MSSPVRCAKCGYIHWREQPCEPDTPEEKAAVKSLIASAAETDPGETSEPVCKPKSSANSPRFFTDQELDNMQAGIVAPVYTERLSFTQISSVRMHPNSHIFVVTYTASREDLKWNRHSIPRFLALGICPNIFERDKGRDTKDTEAYISWYSDVRLLVVLVPKE